MNKKQDGSAWLEQRVGMITGSRVPAILGHSPWQSREGLMIEMIKEYQGNPQFKSNIALQWGIDHEQDALELYEEMYGEIVTQHGFIKHKDIPFIGCSPDGTLGNEVLLEFKCPFNKKIPDSAPQHYIDQCQFNMHVMGMPETHLFYWTPEKHYLFNIGRDDDWWDNTLPILVEFIDEFNVRKDQELETERVVEEEEAIEIAQVLYDLNQQIIDLTTKEKALKKELSDMVDIEDYDGKVYVGRMYCQRQTRKGGYDYKKFLTETNTEIPDKYKKPDTTFTVWRVRK